MKIKTTREALKDLESTGAVNPGFWEIVNKIEDDNNLLSYLSFIIESLLTPSKPRNPELDEKNEKLAFELDYCYSLSFRKEIVNEVCLDLRKFGLNSLG